MHLGDHIANLGENSSSYATRLKLPIPTITRYLKGQRGLAANSLHIILIDAKGKLTLDDLLPNPYKQNGDEKAVQKKSP